MATANMHLMYLSLLNQSYDVVGRVLIQSPNGGEQLKKLQAGGFITLEGERCEIVDRIDDDIPEIYIKPVVVKPSPVRYQ